MQVLGGLHRPDTQRERHAGGGQQRHIVEPPRPRRHRARAGQRGEHRRPRRPGRRTRAAASPRRTGCPPWPRPAATTPPRAVHRARPSPGRHRSGRPGRDHGPGSSRLLDNRLRQGSVSASCCSGNSSCTGSGIRRPAPTSRLIMESDTCSRRAISWPLTPCSDHRRTCSSCARAQLHRPALALINPAEPCSRAVLRSVDR